MNLCRNLCEADLISNAEIIWPRLDNRDLAINQKAFKFYKSKNSLKKTVNVDLMSLIQNGLGLTKVDILLIWYILINCD